MVKHLRFFAILLGAFSFHSQIFAQPGSVAKAGPGMGQGLYEQSGANSCLYCHGLGGQNGKIAVSANLTKPKTWKTYKGLGGDAGLSKNKAEFLAHMEEAIVTLIKTGSTIHNSAFKAVWFDKAAAGGNYNSQMIGITGSPSQNWLKKYKDRGVDKDIAAKAAFLYVKTLDSQGVFDK